LGRVLAGQPPDVLAQMLLKFGNDSSTLGEQQQANDRTSGGEVWRSLHRPKSSRVSVHVSGAEHIA
jgi:hypothetical protein